MDRTTPTLTTPKEGEERLGTSDIRYEDDPHAWALKQAELLKAGRLQELDVVNLADEIEDVARREFVKLESDLTRVTQHLFKWDYQPARRSRGWVLTIQEHRRRVARQLKDNPSLESRRAEALQEAFEAGRLAALRETDLPDDALPTSNRLPWDDVMTRPVVWPEP